MNNKLNPNICEFLEALDALCDKYDITLRHADAPHITILDNKTHDQYDAMLSDHYNEL